MTQIFADGFESGDFSAWTGVVNSPAVETNNPHHGANNAIFDAAETVYKTITAASIIFYRAYVKFAAVDPPNKLTPLALYGSGGNTSIRTALVGISSNGFWRMEHRHSGGWVAQTDTEGPTAGVYYCMELYIKMSTTGNADGEQKLYINGIERLSASNIDNDDRGLIIGIQLGELTESTVRTHYADCVVIADAYIGPEASSTLQTVTDGLGLADLVLCNKTFGITDGVGAADSLFRHRPLLLIADVLGIADFVNVITGALIKTVADAIGLSDLALINKSALVADVVGVLDQVFRSKPHVSVLDVVAAVEVVLASKLLPVSDVVGLSDLFLVLKSLRVSDVLGFVDVVSTPSRVLQAFDGIGLLDGGFVDKVLVVSENVSLLKVVEVGVGGARRTRLFLVLGDLAVQLMGD